MRSSPSKFAQVAGIMLAMALTFSCSGDSGGGNGDQSNISSGTEASKETSSSSKGTSKSSSSNEAGGNSSSSSLGGSSSSNGNEVVGSVKKDKISGFSQKGPFTKGSAITLSELNDKLAQTGRSFEEIIADDKGSFEIKNIELVSPYVMLKVNGYYRNEVSGKISTAPINLYAIADIREKSNVNVNILTHLEYYRVQKLVEGGKSLRDAKKQAQKEILAVFNISGEFKNSEDMSIFGTTDADAALLAISVLLQGDLTEGQFTERLSDFSVGFREKGTWDNNEAKKAMADWASGEGWSIEDREFNYCYYEPTTQYPGNKNCWPMPTNDMCENGILVKNCNSGLIPGNMKLSFASVRKNISAWNLSSSVPDFEKYVNNYWITYYNLGTCDAKKAGEFKEGPSGKIYICKDNAWAKATEYEIEFGLCSKEGEIKEKEFTVETGYYICKDKAWARATDYERDTYQWVCSKTDEVKTGQVTGAKYTCRNNVWVIAPKCLESKSCLTFTDTRDKQTYYSVKIGNQTWMAQNLNYDTKTTGNVCYDNKPANCDQYGKLYDWETAKKACPTGWHLPSNGEWQELVDLAGGNNVAGNKLKAAGGWSERSRMCYSDKSGKLCTVLWGNGTDDYGFSALPGGYGFGSIFEAVGGFGNWWSASEYNSDEAYGRFMYYSNDSANRGDSGKDALQSVRCLQD